MEDEDKSKAELLRELKILRKELEKGALKDFIKHKLLVEQDLRESEEKYRNLIESINESIILIDLQGKLLTLNSRAVSYLGGSAEDYIGKTLWDIFPPKVAEERFAGLQKVIQSGEPLVTESYIPFQGKMLCFLYSMQPIRNRAGDIYAVLILASDITERKQAEDKLKDSEEYLKILFDYAPDAYYISDLEGNFVDCNKEAERLTGYKKEELIGKNFLKLKMLFPVDIPKEAKLFTKELSELPTGTGELVLNRKDNTKVTVEISAYPVKIKGKTFILGIARDITERKKAEKALVESKEKYHTVFENTGTTTMVIEEDMTISMVNAQCKKLSGYSKKEIENKMKWTDFII
ncbi:MAG: PAS domain S-box protein, partial [Candidatus Pacearchaeota archaeon]|nr:PAS domain S-box protein [Candidatus Pacearchaeota archaeon]